MANIKLFNDKTIRSSWNADEEEWYFSVVDIVAALTESSNPKDYLKKIRLRDDELNSKWGTICHPVENIGKDGRKRKVLMSKTKNVLRLIQSIPSPKAEPFKLWLAQVGSERLDEIADPQKALDRGIEYYRAKGYPEEWIQQRLRTIDARRELTNEYKKAGVTESKDYAILTNEMTIAWSGHSVKGYKQLKGLTKENLRDNMTNLELALNTLAEITTAEICKSDHPVGFEETKKASIDGGSIAGNARKEIENRLGRSVISKNNAKDKEKLIDKK